TFARNICQRFLQFRELILVLVAQNLQLRQIVGILIALHFLHDLNDNIRTYGRTVQFEFISYSLNLRIDFTEIETSSVPSATRLQVTKLNALRQTVGE